MVGYRLMPALQQIYSSLTNLKFNIPAFEYLVKEFSNSNNEKKEEVKQKMLKVDKDGSGAIDKDEFMALMAEQIDARNQEDELRKVFRIYDDDDNGLITAGNLLRCAGDLGEDVTQEEVEMMISMANDEENRNGVTKDDFIKLMKEVGLIPKEKKHDHSDDAHRFHDHHLDSKMSHKKANMK